MRLLVDGESLKIYVFSRLFTFYLSPPPPLLWSFYLPLFFWLGYPGKRAFEGLSTKEQLLVIVIYDVLLFLLPNQHKDKAFTLTLHKTLNLPDCLLLLGLYVCLIQSEFDKMLNFNHL